MQNPSVTVEVEKYTSDLSNFAFVAIPGRLEEVQDPEIKNIVRQKFVELIKKKNLSSNVLSALGHSPDEPIEALLTEERNNVWKLAGVNVRAILGLKHSAVDHIFGYTKNLVCPRDLDSRYSFGNQFSPLRL